MTQAPWPYMPAVLVPIGNSPASTMTREFNESYSRKMERYSSLPALDNDDKHSTLIKIQVYYAYLFYSLSISLVAFKCFPSSIILT